MDIEMNESIPIVNQQQQEDEQKTEKKKRNSRGTRRQQRYRAKQRLLELCELASAQAAAIDVMKIDQQLLEDHVSDGTEKSLKRKATAEELVTVAATMNMTSALTLTADQVIQPFSQLSIVAPSMIAPAVTVPSEGSQEKKCRVLKSGSAAKKHRIRRAKQHMKKNKTTEQAHMHPYSPDYLNVPNRIFKQMFLAASEHLISTDQQQIMNNILNNSINMTYIRTHARLLDQLLYLKLQQSLWTDYFNLGTCTEADGGNVWASEVQEKFRRCQVMNGFTFDNPLLFVDYYRKNIDQQIQIVENELNEHINNFNMHKTLRSSQIQTLNLSAILKALVRKGQHKLNAEFQGKRRLLHFDCQDHSLMKTFFALKPTKKQIRSAEKIWSATFKQQVAEEQVSMLKNQLFCKKLPKSLNIFDQSLNDINLHLHPKVIDKDLRTKIISRRDKVIGQAKLDMMAIYISTAEATARGHAKIAKEEFDKLLLLISNSYSSVPVPVATMMITAANTDEHRRSINQTSLPTTIVHIPHLILPSSAAIVEVATSFKDEHLSMLAYGPKYVPKCQSYFSSKSKEDIIEREYQMMLKIIKSCLTDNCVSASDEKAQLFFTSLKSLLTKLYTTKLPYGLFYRARKENRLMKEIQHHLYAECHQIILRRTDKSKVFHLGSNADYQEKAMNYMKKTCAYEEVKNGKCPLADNLSLVITLLDKLLLNKAINYQQYSQMIPKKDKVELGHLYFLPKPHKIGTPLRPIISSIHGPTIGVSHFLDYLLRPMFDCVAKQTTFVNGLDLIRHLDSYRDSGKLTPMTQFITFDVTDLYTMIPRNGALDVLGRFLVKNSIHGKIKNLSVDTILKLARLVLDTNYFAYNDKYYRQIKGGAMGSPFTMTLANVYMLEWEQPLIESQSKQGELYGRYIDDVFMTSNMSTDVIRAQLDWMNKRDEKHIQITYSIGLSAEFLDVHIENDCGLLKTSVYRKLAAEPYVLPYSSDHPRHIHANIPYEILLRAVRYCSDVYTFDQERLDIEMMFILNGYPPSFLRYHFNRFFRLYQATKVLTELDADLYEEMHRKILYLPTRREKLQQTKYPRLCKDGNIEDHVDLKDPNKIDQTKIIMWNKKILLLPHTFQSGPSSNFKREFRQLWRKFYVYKGSVMNNVRLMITTLSNPSLNDLLVRKKPSRFLLTKMEDISLPLLPPATGKKDEHKHE